MTELPAELFPTLEIAASLLDMGAYGEKLASVGIWLHGELVGGSFYEYYFQKGKDRLGAWRRLQGGRLRRWYQGSYVTDLGCTKAAPIQALADALTYRALKGPTELTTDELAALLRGMQPGSRKTFVLSRPGLRQNAHRDTERGNAMKTIHIIIFPAFFAALVALGGCMVVETDKSKADSGPAPDVSHCAPKASMCEENCYRGDLGLGCVICCKRNGSKCERSEAYGFEGCFEKN